MKPGTQCKPLSVLEYGGSGAQWSLPLLPTLGYMALTAPYFHSGTVNELSDAVCVMGSLELGRVLAAEDGQLLVAFLESPSGEVPAYTQPGVQMSVLERASR